VSRFSGIAESLGSLGKSPRGNTLVGEDKPPAVPKRQQASQRENHMIDRNELTTPSKEERRIL
jgi:hypothetical protein